MRYRASIPIALVALLAIAPAGASSDLCPGDCDDDGRVSVAELVRGVRCLLKPTLAFEPMCDACFAESPRSISFLIRFVNSAVHGCFAQPEAIPTPTPAEVIEESETWAVFTYLPSIQQCGGSATSEWRSSKSSGAGPLVASRLVHAPPVVLPSPNDELVDARAEPYVEALRADGWTIERVVVTIAEAVCAACGCPVPGSPIIEITVSR